MNSKTVETNNTAQLRAENHAAGENEAAPSGALADAPCSALSVGVTHRKSGHVWASCALPRNALYL